METKRKYEEVIETLRKSLKDQKEENRNLEIEKTKDQKKFKQLADKHKSIVDQLKDKIECPVCMEIPQTGPVPVCPNGHVVCKNCKTLSCPTCRVDMGSGRSLIASTIIENIEHECKFDECREYFALEKLADHMKVCSHRTVVCPCVSCMEKVALSKLLDHLYKNKCSYDSAPTLMGESFSVGEVGFGLELDQRDKRNLSWNVYTFSYDDVSFGIFPEKHDGVYYFSVVMFSSEAECSKYKVEITVHEYGSTAQNCDANFKFCGKPCSIDQDKKKLKYLGLSVNSEGMEQILRNVKGFSMSFSVSKK